MSFKSSPTSRAATSRRAPTPIAVTASAAHAAIHAPVHTPIHISSHTAVHVPTHTPVDIPPHIPTAHGAPAAHVSSAAHVSVAHSGAVRPRPLYGRAHVASAVRRIASVAFVAHGASVCTSGRAAALVARTVTQRPSSARTCLENRNKTTRFNARQNRERRCAKNHCPVVVVVVVIVVSKILHFITLL